MRLKFRFSLLALAGAASLLAGCASQPIHAAGSNVVPPSIQPTVSQSVVEGSLEPTLEPSKTPSSSPTESVTSSPTESVAPKSSPSPSPVVAAALFKPGDKDEKIREIQHRLLQINWFEGAISADFNPDLQAAVEGFQAKRGLPVTGEIDEQTLAKLREMTRVPTDEEMHNILVAGPAILAKGDKSDAVRDLQVRLKQIDWFQSDIDGIYGASTVEGVTGFQRKRGFPATGEVDKRTQDRLNAMTRKPTADELNNIFAKPKPKEGFQLDERCLTGRAICISKKSRKLAWVIDGKVQMTMSVRFGATKTPTREGSFSVEWKSRDHHSKLYDSPMPFALFFSGGQAVHYSSDFAARGYRGASHGCVNVRDKAAVQSLFNQAHVGDKVIVYSG